MARRRFFWGSTGTGMLGLDAILTIVILVVEVFPFDIIGIGVRQRLGPPRPIQLTLSSEAGWRAVKLE
ncbi:MAG: hypothetical protein ACYCPO_15945 [Acidobacteriaceae bacterium]